MTEKIIIAGAGGQGIMLFGKVLAQSAMQESKSVTWFPAYGAEVRGGTAYCMVTISDREISSPYIGKADTLITMNKPSQEKFKPRLKNKGLFIANSLKYPFTDIAVKLGNIRVANMVALGYYLTQKKIIKIKTVQKVIAEMAPADKKDLVQINKKALAEGIKLNDQS